jgi:hypothetical protein
MRSVAARVAARLMRMSGRRRARIALSCGNIDGASGARTRNLRTKSTLIRFSDAATCADVRWSRVGFPSLSTFRRLAIGRFIGSPVAACARDDQRLDYGPEWLARASGSVTGLAQ